MNSPVDVPEIILQMVKSETSTRVKKEPDEDSDVDNESCESADRKDIQSKDHEETTTKNLETSSFSRAKCEPNKHFNLNESSHLCANNGQNKNLREHQVIKPGNRSRSFMTPENGSDQFTYREQPNAATYIITVEDVQRVLGTMTTKENKVKSLPTSKNRSNMDNHISLCNSATSLRRQVPNLKVRDAHSSFLYAKDVQNRNFYQNHLISPLKHPTLITQGNKFNKNDHRIKTTSLHHQVPDVTMHNPWPSLVYSKDDQNKTYHQHKVINPLQYPTLSNVSNQLNLNDQCIPVTSVHHQSPNLRVQDVMLSHLSTKKDQNKTLHQHQENNPVEPSISTNRGNQLNRHDPRKLATSMQQHVSDLGLKGARPLQLHAKDIQNKAPPNEFVNPLRSATAADINFLRALKQLNQSIYSKKEKTMIFNKMSVLNKNIHQHQVINPQHHPSAFYEPFQVPKETNPSNMSFETVDDVHRSLETVAKTGKMAKNTEEIDKYQEVPQQTVAPSFVSIEIMDSDDEEIITHVTTHTQTENIARQDDIKYQQPTTNIKKEIDYIDLTNDCNDLKNGHVEPTNTRVECENIGVDPITSCIDLTSQCIDATYKCQICDKMFLTPSLLTDHLKQCIGSKHNYSGEGKRELVGDSSSQTKVNGEIFTNDEQRDDNNSISSANICKLSEKDMYIHNLKVILECTNATLIGSCENVGYKCFFCNDHIQNPLDLKKHTIYHTRTIKDNVYNVDLIANICTNFEIKLDITDLWCRLCCREIDTITELIKHLKTVHKKKMFHVKNHVQVVKFKNTSLDIVNDEISNQTNNKHSSYKFKCCFCSDRFENLKLKDLHILKAHSVEGTNKCIKPTDKFEPLRIQCNGAMHSCEKSANTNVGTKYHSNVFVAREASPVEKEEYTSTINKGKIGVINERPVIENIQTIPEYDLENSALMAENNDESLNKDIEMTASNEQKLCKELQTVNDEKLKSDKYFYSHILNNIITPKEKHVYNIKTILECTNATLIRPRVDFACTCYFCRMYFTNPLDLKIHSLNEHTVIKDTYFSDMCVSKYIAMLDITDLCCKLCNDFIDTVENLIVHLNESHNKNLFIDIKNQILPFKYNNDFLICSVCPMNFKNFRSLFSHLHSHYTNFPCKICRSGFVNLQKLRRHELLTHKTGYLSCDSCSKIFRKRVDMKKHLKAYHNERSWMYKCDICNKSFKDIINKELHLRKYHVVNFENVSAETMNMNAVPANISVEPQNIRIEPQHISVELQNISVELQNISVELQNINVEPQNINVESQYINVKPQNISVKPENINMEIFQKCHTCNMVFLTWDTLSEHVKVCSTASRFFEDLDTMVKKESNVDISTDDAQNNYDQYDEDEVNNLETAVKMEWEEDAFVPPHGTHSDQYDDGGDMKLRLEASPASVDRFNPVRILQHDIQRERSYLKPEVPNNSFDRHQIKQMHDPSTSHDRVGSTSGTISSQNCGPTIENNDTASVTSTIDVQEVQNTMNEVDKVTEDTKSRQEASSSSVDRLNPVRILQDVIQSDSPYLKPDVPNNSAERHQVKPMQDPSTSYDPVGSISSTISIGNCGPTIENTDTASVTSTTDFREVQDTVKEADKVIEDCRTSDHGIKDSTEQSGDTLRENHLCNLTLILNCTNATLIRCQNEAGYKCYFCSNCFTNPSELKQHNLQVHGKIKNNHFTYETDCVANMDVTGLRCKICDQQIDSFECLRDHLDERHEKKLYPDVENKLLWFRFSNDMPQCCVCSHSFNSLQILVDHMRSHYRNFVCGICKAAFATTFKLALHEKSQHAGAFPCQFCGKRLKTNRMRENHEKIVHHRLYAHKCYYCGDRFRILEQKRLHLKWVHYNGADVPKILKHVRPNDALPDDGELLSQQDRYFSNISLILNCTNATLLYSQELFGYICYFCNRYFETPSKLKEHALDTHKIIPKLEIYRSYHLRNVDKLDITGLRCKLCDTYFNNLEKMKDHLEKDHNKHFYFETETRTIPLLFNEETPQCCYCKEEFDNCQALTKHTRSHYRNYVCSVCDLGFVSRKQLIHHITNNEKDHGSFKCNICSEPFNNCETLKEHEKIYHDEVYQGNYSNKVYRSRDIKDKRRLTLFKAQCAVFKNPISELTSSTLQSSTSANDSGNTTREYIDVASEITDRLNVRPEPVSVDIRNCKNDVAYNSGQCESNTLAGNEKPVIEIILKYKNEQALQNDVDVTVNVPQNIRDESQNIKMEISQKCHTCNMVFMTWDALSVHIKECDYFAQRFSGEAEEISESKIDPGRETSKKGNQISGKTEKRREEDPYMLRNSLIAKGLCTENEKHFYNLKVILESTNATLIREKRGNLFACYFCNKSYENPEDLKKHNTNSHMSLNRVDFKIPVGHRIVVAHLDTTDLYCKLCNVNIDNFLELFNHLSEVHQRALFDEMKNQILAFKFTYYLNAANEKVYRYLCDLCNREFGTRNAIKYHVNTHYEFTMTSCGFCNESFSNSKLKELHMTFHHNVRKLNDNVKPRDGVESTNPIKDSNKRVAPTNERINLTKERVAPTNEYVDLTNECVESSQKRLKRTDEGPKQMHKCHICDKAFPSPKAVRIHIERFHLKVRNHHCSVCNKGFYSIGELKIHATKHTKVPAFRCQICNNSYMRRNYFDEHMRIHANDRRYKCDICDKSFTSRTVLLHHNRSLQHRNNLKS